MGGSERAAVTPLLVEELQWLWATRSEAEWTAASKRIKDRRGGVYPPDWHARVLEPGIMEDIRWGWKPPEPEPPYETLSERDQLRRILESHGYRFPEEDEPRPRPGGGEAMTYRFDIHLSSDPALAGLPFEDFVKATCMAGCDDVSFSLKGGVLHAAFNREAPSQREAVASALDDLADAFRFLSDADAAREALADIEAHGTVPWERIKADLGLSPEASELLRRGIDQARASELVPGPDLDADSHEPIPE
jgi:hypothetical protein